jgi:hypothetical protein
MNSDVKQTIQEFLLAYFILAAFCYLTYFQWEWLDSLGLVPDVVKYYCGNKPSSSIRTNSTTTFDNDLLLLSSHQHKPVAFHPRDIFAVNPLTIFVYWTVKSDQFCLRCVL